MKRTGPQCEAVNRTWGRPKRCSHTAQKGHKLCGTHLRFPRGKHDAAIELHAATVQRRRERFDF